LVGSGLGPGGSRRAVRGGRESNKRSYLRRWLDQPRKVRPARPQPVATINVSDLFRPTDSDTVVRPGRPAQAGGCHDRQELDPADVVRLSPLDRPTINLQEPVPGHKAD